LLSSLQQVNNCFCKYFILFFYEFALSISCVASPFLGKMGKIGWKMGSKMAKMSKNAKMNAKMRSHLDRLSENCFEH